MYEIINKNINAILNVIPDNHVPMYDWLKEKLKIIDVSSNVEYQKKYRYYWVMRYISPESEFQSKYFKILESRKTQNSISIISLCEELFDTPSDKNGTSRSFQFSFITKLAHMVDGNLPIYDSKVSSFFSLPSLTNKNKSEKINAAIDCINYLYSEYNDVISKRLLEDSICKFKARFKPKHFTDKKIIDSLIWACDIQISNDIIKK